MFKGRSAGGTVGLYDPLANTVLYQEYTDVPSSLPDWLIPESKAHLVQATRALTGSQPSFEQVDTSTSDDDTPGLKDGFDWYMSPADKAKYSEIYTANRDSRGEISFQSLEPLYASLDVPDTDIHSAWNLVNPSSSPSIGKDAALAFLHILNNRHEGYRIPRSIPASLRASFERGTIVYQVDRVQSPPSAQRYGDSDTPSGRKAKFGDTYLSRLGVGGKTSYTPSGTDFSSSKTTPDWEEVRLKKQLSDLESKIDRIESSPPPKPSSSHSATNAKPALLKRELEQLIEYKRREARELELGEGKVESGRELQGLREEIGGVRELVEGLERHLREREGVLRGVGEGVEGIKAN